MNPIVFVGVFAALVAAGVTLLLVRPVLGGRMVWPALAAAVVTTVVTVVVGRLLAVASLEFLLGISAFALPVLILLEAAAVASGADRFARWLLMLGWGVIVFPVSAIVPLLFTRGCLAPECGFEDFGGALPLMVSSSAYVLLAWLPVGVRERAELDRQSGRRALLAVVVLWLAVIVWLAHLEGTIDSYLPRIALAAVVVPLAGALGWLLVDALRNTRRPVGRSLMLGLVAGMVAVLPGAVNVGLPWSPLVGLLAGGIAGLVFSGLGGETAGLASRWGMTVFAASAIGFLAPPVSGDTIGLIFSARAAVLGVPAVVFIGVTALSIAISAPIWVMLRRHATRERIPKQILVDE